MTKSSPNCRIQKRIIAGAHLLVGLFFILSLAGCGQTAETGSPQPGPSSMQPQAKGAKQASDPQPQVQQQSYAPDEVLVRFMPETDAKTIERIRTELKLETMHRFSTPNLFLMKITDGTSVEAIIDRLQKSAAVKYAEPNYVVKTTQ